MSCRPVADDESDNYELRRSRRYSPDPDSMVMMPPFRTGAFDNLFDRDSQLGFRTASGNVLYTKGERISHNQKG